MVGVVSNMDFVGSRCFSWRRGRFSYLDYKKGAERMKLKKCKHCQTWLVPIKTDKGNLLLHSKNESCKKVALQSAFNVEILLMDQSLYDEYLEEFGMVDYSVEEVFQDYTELKHLSECHVILLDQFNQDYGFSFFKGLKNLIRTHFFKKQ